MIMTSTEKQQKEKKVGLAPELVMTNLHDAIGVPEDYSHTKAINVFDNRWRINVYRFRRDGIPSLIRRVFIGDYSFFVQVDNSGKITSELKKPW
jgi:hypothetical protein